MLKRIWTLFKARNWEFLRDRSAFAWNILFPILVIVGFNLLFSDDRQILYKVGIIGPAKKTIPADEAQLNSFEKMRHIEFIPFQSEDQALYNLLHHRIDLLINQSKGAYWT